MAKKQKSPESKEKQKARELRRIERLIREAQIASDAGKGIYTICESERDKDVSRGQYHAKDDCILRAIEAICRLKGRSIRFSVERSHVEKSDGSKGAACFIVYFNFYIDDGKGQPRREQVSFHSFYDELWPYVKNSKATTWDRRDCRRSAQKLKQRGVSRR